MLNKQKFLHYKSRILFGILTAGFMAALVFPGLSGSINDDLNGILIGATGGKEGDSGIVVIKIEKDDIERLGGWPLKRNYYALLLKSIGEFQPAIIGIEIFFGKSAPLQSIYNDLLISEIKEIKNVVLGSVAFDIEWRNNLFSADSIAYPEIYTSDMLTGHLNYSDKNGIVIPSEIYLPSGSERSFGTAVYELYTGRQMTYKEIKLNAFTSWNDYRSYSFLEFFRKYENGDKTLNDLKDKIVLIGVSDPEIAKSVETYFDEDLPGIGLHALFIDNLMNNSHLNSDYNTAFLVLIAAALIVLLYFDSKRKLYLTAVIFVLITLLYAFLYLLLDLYLNYSAFLIPLILYLTAHFFMRVLEERQRLSRTLSESDILKKALESKEKELLRLKGEIGRVDNYEKEKLNSKIQELQGEIDLLQQEENEEAPAYLDVDPLRAEEFEGIIYKSRKMRNVIELVKKVAPEDATVVILGESGSGKELVANAIHNLSNRRKEKFVAVNCAALSDTLLESELFGHVKGAFTNAINDKIGRFEAADMGTIFLDEIGETSENFQLKLLRVLQTGEFQRVGSSETVHSNVRIIAATNKNLEQLVSEKKFREDLYYRLNVFRIELPPLRERKEDIPYLAHHFLKRENPGMGMTDSVVQKLGEQNWKGNIRELESVIRRSMIFAKAEGRNLLKLSDLPAEIAKIRKTDLEALIIKSLREKGFSRSSINQTAKELGNLNRTMISENFRGFVFKTLYENRYDLSKTIAIIAGSESAEIMGNVESKVDTYVNNIKNDILRNKHMDFRELKDSFVSKYKNLPQKYHFYMDELIKHLMTA